MTRHPHAALIAGATAWLLAACGSTPLPPDAATLIRQSEAAMGSAQLKTLQLAGRGTGATFGQA